VQDPNRKTLKEQELEGLAERMDSPVESVDSSTERVDSPIERVESLSLAPSLSHESPLVDIWESESEAAGAWLAGSSEGAYYTQADSISARLPTAVDPRRSVAARTSGSKPITQSRPTSVQPRAARTGGSRLVRLPPPVPLRAAAARTGESSEQAKCIL
jgi:hypothetical protein